MTDLIALAEWCEKAAADEQAALLTEAHELIFPAQKIAEDGGASFERRIRWDGLMKWRAYESAAMSLVPEGWEDWELADFLERVIKDWFLSHRDEPDGQAKRARLPLYVCAAALRARASADQ